MCLWYPGSGYLTQSSLSTPHPPRFNKVDCIFELNTKIRIGTLTEKNTVFNPTARLKRRAIISKLFLFSLGSGFIYLWSDYSHAAID